MSGNKTAEDLEDLDRRYVFHPFALPSDHAQSSPRIMVGGKGAVLTDSRGNAYIDGMAGLWCANVGYGRPELAECLKQQALKLSYYHSFSGMGTDAPAILSEKLVAMAPGRMSKVFFGNSGSDANDTQVKIVWYYNNLRGRPKKKKIISRERGYHGCSVVAGSMTGMSFYHDHMDLPVGGILHTGVPHHYWGSEPGETEEQFSHRRAVELEALILREDPETVGAFIGEPVLGTGGIIPPPDGYWREIQAVLRKYDVLLIADEVVCGFGRLGTPFGCHRYGIEPDLVTAAKGLTSAYFPLSAAILSERIYRVLEDGAERVGAFSHGYTYSGHPIGAAAANAVLDIVEREDLAGNAARVGSYFQERLRVVFSQMPTVGEVRGEGMLAAVEFVADRGSKKRFSPSLQVGARIAKAARDQGLIVRAMPHGDILGFAPPLVASPADVDEIVGIAEAAVRAVMNELPRETTDES